MNLKDEAAWKKWEEANIDPYGKCCVDVARRVMELLDDGRDFDTHKIICQADDETKSGGITGFMAGCIAEMVSVCHERGEEFRQQWNRDNAIQPEHAAKANKMGGVINPALLTISTE